MNWCTLCDWHRGGGVDCPTLLVALQDEENDKAQARLLSTYCLISSISKLQVLRHSFRRCRCHRMSKGKSRHHRNSLRKSHRPANHINDHESDAAKGSLPHFTFSSLYARRSVSPMDDSLQSEDVVKPRVTMS